MRLQKELILSQLLQCLLTNEEMKQNWSQFKDPFPEIKKEEELFHKKTCQ